MAIHIYCGDGKGKTTSSIGLAIRALGSGWKVHFLQLLKGRETSEIDVLKLIPNISISRCHKDFGFAFSMSEEDKKELIETHNKLLKDALELVKNEKIDMLIIDEFNAAYEYNLLDKSLAEKIFDECDKIELVVTGRNPNQKFIDKADYVSEILGIKHPFNEGLSARKGIEY